jgi:hypothetical protein
MPEQCRNAPITDEMPRPTTTGANPSRGNLRGIPAAAGRTRTGKLRTATPVLPSASHDLLRRQYNSLLNQLSLLSTLFSR